MPPKKIAAREKSNSTSSQSSPKVSGAKTTNPLTQMEQTSKTINCKACNNVCLEKQFIKSDDDGSISCDSCGNWFHKPCSDTTSNEWEILTSDNERILYNCNECLTNKGQKHKELKEIKKLIQDNNETLIKVFESMESRIFLKVEQMIDEKIEKFSEKNDKKIDEKIKNYAEEKEKIIEEFKEIKTKLPELNEKNIEDKIKTQVNQSLDEIKDIEERRNNLIIFNIKESNAESEEESKKDDLKKVKEIIEFSNPELKDTIIQELNVESITRLGRKTRQSASAGQEPKSRPLKLTLPTPSLKFKVLKNSFKMKDCQTHKKIGFKLDLTKKQQEEDKALREELEIRKSRQEDVMIFRGKVILRTELELYKKRININSGESNGQESPNH